MNKKILITLGVVEGTSAIAFSLYLMHKRYYAGYISPEELEAQRLVAKEKEKVKAREESLDEEELYSDEEPFWTEEEEDYYAVQELTEDEENEDEVFILEELDELKYDPNTVEAFNAWKARKLVGVEEGDIRESLDVLFDYNFVPTNAGDEILYSRLIEARVNFFGPNTKYVHVVSFAEVMLYYAWSLSYNYGEDIEFWLNEFIVITGLFFDVGESTKGRIVDKLTNHEMSLFAIPRSQYYRVTESASKTVEDVVTFDMEYNVYLNLLLEEE